MSLLGPEGLESLAVRNLAACTLAKQKLGEIGALKFPHDGSHHFNEFVVELPASTEHCLTFLDSVGVVGGFNLSTWYPKRTNWLLVTCTDQTSEKEIEILAQHISEWVHSLEVAA